MSVRSEWRRDPQESGKPVTLSARGPDHNGNLSIVMYCLGLVVALSFKKTLDCPVRGQLFNKAWITYAPTGSKIVCLSSFALQAFPTSLLL